MKRTGNSKIAVVGWGRGMGHKGHMYLASSVITQAAKMNADPYFFVSKTVGKDDPIYPEEKVKIYQRVFPQQATIFQAEGNLNQALQDLASAGYQGVVVVVGADQKQAFQYLEKPNKEGVPVYQSMGFKKLRVISRQETGDSSAELEGPRATPMREILLHPEATEQQKFKVWRDAMPDALGNKEVMDLMRKAESRLLGSHAKKAKLKEAIIMQPNAKINVYYVSNSGNRHVVAKGITYPLLQKLVIGLEKKYNISMDDLEIRPVDMTQYSNDRAVAETALQGQEDLDAKRKALADMEREPGHDKEAIRQRKLDLDKEARAKGLSEGDSAAKYKIKNVGTEGGKDYYISPNTGKKVYKKANVGDHETPSGEHKPKVRMPYKEDVAEGSLNEFAPDDGDESRKFIPWNEFVDQLKQILHKDFDCKESINMNVIKAKFVPYDPMEYGPTMIYSYFERRAGRKGANGVRGQIQVGNFFKGSKPGDNQLMTGFHLLKGTEFERYFDLTFDNLYKIANIIKGNTQGALQFKPEQQVNEFAPGNGDDDGEDYDLEFQVYQCNPDNEFEFIGGPLQQFNDLGRAHDFAYKLHMKNPDKAFMIWQPSVEHSRGGYGINDDEQDVAESSLNEFAPSDDGDNGQEDMFFKYAKLWYNGNLKVQQRVEEILAQAGWEIGELESEEGGAFIVQSGDEDGKTYMGWSAQDLEGLNEGISLDALGRFANIIPSFVGKLVHVTGKEAAETKQMLQILRLKMAGKATPEQLQWMNQQWKDLLKLSIGVGMVGYGTAAAAAHGAAAAAGHGAKDAIFHSLGDIGLEAAAEVLAAKFGIDLIKELTHGLTTSSGKDYEHSQEKAPQQYGVSPAVAAQNQKNLEKKFQQAKMGFGGMSESNDYLDEK